MVSIVKRHPTTGEDVEDFVSNKQLGADAWRQTGVTTFDGNRKRGPKVTFKQIQHHLQQLYGEHIAYGTVVQLCVIREIVEDSRPRDTKELLKSHADVNDYLSLVCFVH